VEEILNKGVYVELPVDEPLPGATPEGGAA